MSIENEIVTGADDEPGRCQFARFLRDNHVRLASDVTRESFAAEAGLLAGRMLAPVLAARREGSYADIENHFRKISAQLGATLAVLDQSPTVLREVGNVVGDVLSGRIIEDRFGIGALERATQERPDPDEERESRSQYWSNVVLLFLSATAHAADVGSKVLNEHKRETGNPRLKTVRDETIAEWAADFLEEKTAHRATRQNIHIDSRRQEPGGPYWALVDAFCDRIDDLLVASGREPERLRVSDATLKKVIGRRRT